MMKAYGAIAYVSGDYLTCRQTPTCTNRASLLYFHVSLFGTLHLDDARCIDHALSVEVSGQPDCWPGDAASRAFRTRVGESLSDVPPTPLARLSGPANNGHVVDSSSLFHAAPPREQEPTRHGDARILDYVRLPFFVEGQQEPISWHTVKRYGTALELEPEAHPTNPGLACLETWCGIQATRTAVLASWNSLIIHGHISRAFPAEHPCPDCSIALA